MSSAEVGLLGLQFVLGMVLNLYIGLPSNGSMSSLPVPSLIVLVLHIVVAFVLVAVAIGIVISALMAKNKSVLSGSLVVVLGVVIAFAAGVVFLYDGQNNIYSLIMALGFLASTAGTQRVRALAVLVRE